ncbi:uncharacterized protein [Procambarus clarkii]|uniref:uncharacterized protein n=1 Tax=Procambarus clarkii TaxID=6728 RepID=UPI001E6709C7|nr:uncharacterized protein LOC123755302 [Procambarus clarkii]
MPPVRVKYVASFSSQDPKHTVEDLVHGRGSWLSHPTEKVSRLQADLQLERATTITYIDIGNSGSVMLSVEVGRSSWPTSQPLVTLLPAVSLITAEEWRAGKNITTVRMFKPGDMSSEAFREKWDKVRIVCLQPFRKDTQFGLSLLRLHTNVEVPSEAPLSKAIINLDDNISQTALKKDELVSRMNLSEVKRKTISQKIGWLENKVLYNSEEGSAGPPLNPVTSPVSRAARLIAMAAKPQTKMNADLDKAELECEALHFLISLNLSVDDIYSLKVMGVRQQFEKQRKKELNHNEKAVFKDIALDYAKQRLENLEKQQEMSVVKSNENEFVVHKKMPIVREKEKSASSVKSNENNKSRDKANKNMHDADVLSIDAKYQSRNTSSAACSPSRPFGKFTFKRVKSPARSKDFLVKQRKSNQNINTPSNDRLKLRQNDDLSCEPLCSPHRNNLALSDSNVITPKKSTRGRPKKTSTPQSSLNKQCKLDVWISPKAKRKKEDKSFACSNRPVQQFALDVDSIDDGFSMFDDDDDTSAPPSRNKIGGSFMDDISANQNAKAQNSSSITPGVQKTPWISRTSVNSNSNSSGHYLGTAPNDKYGVSKNRKLPQKSSVKGDSSYPVRADCNTDMVQCPVCSELFRSQVIESHAASCDLTIYVDSDSEEVGGTKQFSAKAKKNADKVEECPVCGDFINSAELEDHASECAHTMFD